MPGRVATACPCETWPWTLVEDGKLVDGEEGKPLGC